MFVIYPELTNAKCAVLDLEHLKNDADIVFVGKVLEAGNSLVLRKYNTEDFFPTIMAVCKAKLLVLRKIKGEPDGSEVTAITEAKNSDCMINFSEGTDYVVFIAPTKFGSFSDEYLWTTDCSGTRRISDLTDNGKRILGISDSTF